MELAVERLTRERRGDILAAFEKKYDTENDPNVELVCMRYTVYDGDYIEVKARSIMECDYPQLFNDCNVFVEKGSLY